MTHRCTAVSLRLRRRFREASPNPRPSFPAQVLVPSQQGSQFMLGSVWACPPCWNGRHPGAPALTAPPPAPGTAPGTWRALHSSWSLSLSPDRAPPVISGVDAVGCSSSLLLRRGGNVSDDALGSPVRVCEQGVGPEAVGTPSGPAASRLLFSLRPAFSVLCPPPAVSRQEGGEDACSSGEVQVQGKQ